MNIQDLNSCIRNIKEEHSVAEAYLGFFYDDVHEYTSYIKANKEGLRLYASELLQASLEMDTKDFYVFSNDWKHNNSDFLIPRIKFSKELRAGLESIDKEDYKQTWKDRLISSIGIAILIFILISILVGAFTILCWLF